MSTITIRRTRYKQELTSLACESAIIPKWLRHHSTTMPALLCGTSRRARTRLFGGQCELTVKGKRFVRLVSRTGMRCESDHRCSGDGTDRRSYCCRFSRTCRANAKIVNPHFSVQRLLLFVIIAKSNLNQPRVSPGARFALRK